MMATLVAAVACLPCAAQEGNPLPGSVEMAAGLLARHAYVDAGAESGKLGELHRDLREAEYLLGKKETEEAKRREMEAQRDQASRALLAILQACPSAHAVRVGEGQTKAPALGRVELPGDAAAFLFRVDRGEGPAYCVTRNLDFSVDAARTQFPVDVQAPGTAWVLVTLDRIPQGRTLIEFEFNGPGDAMTSVGLETVTMAHGMLAVRVLSDDTGRPAPAMIRLAWRTDGSEVRPANALDFGVLFDRQGQATGQRRMQIPGALGARYWCIPGPFEMALAPGEYEVTVLRGVEHRPVRETVTVRSNERTERTWRPERWGGHAPARLVFRRRPRAHADAQRPGRRHGAEVDTGRGRAPRECRQDGRHLPHLVRAARIRPRIPRRGKTGTSCRRGRNAHARTTSWATRWR